jgi:hypothetical protein
MGNYLMEEEAASLQKALSDPSLIRLYRELSDEDVTMAIEGLTEYQSRVSATDACSVARSG